MIKTAEYSLVLCSLLSLALSCRSGASGPAGAELSGSQQRPAAQSNSTEKGHLPDGAGGEQQVVPYSGKGFRLILPSGVQANEQDSGGDFILYHFFNAGRLLLSAYVGNQPNFLLDDRATGPESIAQLNGLPCKRAQAHKADGSLRTEVLVRFPRDRGWPTYIHFWYYKLEPEDQAKTEAIIASLMPQTQGTERSSFPDTGGPDFPPARRRHEDIIAEMEQELAQMKQQQGMTEQVKALEAELQMRKDIHRGAEEIRRMSPEERKKWNQERSTGEDVGALIIADMERDLEEMKKQQGMTKEEVKNYEAYVAEMKENYIANLERGVEEMKKQQGMTDEVKQLEAYLAKMKKQYHLEPDNGTATNN